MKALDTLVDATLALQKIYGKLLMSDRDGEARITEEDGRAAAEAILAVKMLFAKDNDSNAKYYKKEIWEIIADLEIKCPACEWSRGEDEQCPICKSTSGVGRIGVLDFVDSNAPFFTERNVRDL